MPISSVSLIEINATVIIGLLILITFQILSDPSDILEEKGVKLLEERDALILEHEASQKVIEKACNPEYAAIEEFAPILKDQKNLEENAYCMELAITNSILAEKMDGKINRYNQYVKVREAIDAMPISSLVASMNIAQNFIIVPFVISAVIELKKILIDSKNDNASKIGLNSCIIGFVLLGIVISVSGFVISYQEYIWEAFI